MKKEMELSNLKIGEKAEVKRIKNCQNQLRLQELGFTENTEVLALHKSLSGDPVAYLVRGCVMALRKSDAKSIIVTKEEN